MNIKYKISIAILLTGLLIGGLVLNQYARNEAKSNDPVYRDMLAQTFNQPFLSYQYEVRVNEEDQPIDTSYGMICKSGNSFIDSNNMYYKVLNDELFANFDKGSGIAYYVFLKDVEQKMGFKREDLDAELFSMPDSTIAKAGHWKPILSLNDSMSAIEFEVTDSTQQIRHMRFVIHKKQQQIREAELTISGADMLGGPDRSAVIRMYNISNDSLDLASKAQSVFVQQGDKIEPASRYKNYSVKKLF